MEPSLQQVGLVHMDYTLWKSGSSTILWSRGRWGQRTVQVDNWKIIVSWIYSRLLGLTLTAPDGHHIVVWATAGAASGMEFLERMVQRVAPVEL